MARPTSTMASVFWKRVIRLSDSECWPCSGAKAGGIPGNRYGVLKVGGRKGRIWYAHRASWVLHRGEIPEGMQVCHRCDNAACCNPSHLFLGTLDDNMKDMREKGRAARGLRIGGAKFSWRVILDIRANYALCRVTQQELADRYSVSLQHVNNIVNHKRRTIECPEEFDQ